MSDDKRWGMTHEADPRQASPERLAYEAYERGDRLFQIDLAMVAYQGHIGIGWAATRTLRGEPVDVLGRIEEQGWRLEHVSTTFVLTGSSSTKRILANAGSDELATHGQLVALYVFRRGERQT